MLELHTEIEIEAPAARVWQILTEFAAYATWNPFVPRIEGTATVGEKIEVTLQPPGGKPMTVRPTVLAAERERRFAWLGRLGGVPKLFDGEHSFAIEPLGPNRVRFVPHHVAHAASAYLAGPHRNCAVLVLDGRGEATSSLAGHVNDGELRVLNSVPLPNSPVNPPAGPMVGSKTAESVCTAPMPVYLPK